MFKKKTRIAVTVLAIMQSTCFMCGAMPLQNDSSLYTRPHITSHKDSNVITEDTTITWDDVKGTSKYRVTLSDENGFIENYDVDTNSCTLSKDELIPDKVYELKVTNLYGQSFLMSSKPIKLMYSANTSELSGSATYDTLYDEEKPILIGNKQLDVPVMLGRSVDELPKITEEEYFVVDKALGSVGKSISDVDYMSEKIEKQEEKLTQSNEVVKKNIPDDEKWGRIFPDGHSYTSPSEAEPHIKTVEIPAWNIGKNGNKYATTYSLQVNENLADEVVEIFVEIFNDPEQFPIKCIGGWRWSYLGSGKLSQHNYGTCIDINPDENYMIRANGTIEYPGFWRPYENPYSITPDGSVLRAFRKRGWGWGGADWRSSRDYMHMTYLGG